MRSLTKFRLFVSLFPAWMSYMHLENWVTGVTISSVQVPALVPNGSESGALLDCLYTLESWEQMHNSGLVVKWFFNRSLNPIYQWIHNQKPRVAGILKGRLKLDYKASDNHTYMYRAMKIIRPTIELSGEYKCLVSTHHDEDSMIQSMTVFVPERRMDFVHRRQDWKKINFSCRVEGVYPKPVLQLFKDPSITDSGLISDVTINILRSRSGTYDMITSAVFPIEALTTATVFDCELQLPGTTYKKRKTTLFLPDSMRNSLNVNETAIALPTPSFYVVLVFVLWITNVRRNQNTFDFKSRNC